MFVVQNDLYGNLICIFFLSLTKAFFFSSLFAVSQTFVPWIFAVENSGKAFFFFCQIIGRRKSWFPVVFTLLAPISRNSTLKWRPFTKPWLISITSKWIYISWWIDGFYREAAVTWAQSVDSTTVWKLCSTLQSLAISLYELAIASCVCQPVTDMQDLVIHKGGRQSHYHVQHFWCILCFLQYFLIFTTIFS